GARPKNFKHTIKIDMLDGTKGTIECTFKYRTRKEFGELVDSVNAAQKEAQKKADADAMKQAADAGGAQEQPFSMGAFQAKVIDANAGYILQILDGWNLDIDLTLEAVDQLANEYPGAATAMVEAYRVAITEGRLGN
ncbi:MAG TPA: phage tail assembly chaperone, partial [Pseudorhodoferax sp.]|nr:phage tail assembly chaperone [Pseudorhodoferax sp.]